MSSSDTGMQYSSSSPLPLVALLTSKAQSDSPTKMARVLFADSTTWGRLFHPPERDGRDGNLPPRVLPAFGEWNGRMPDAVRVVDPRGIVTGRRKIYVGGLIGVEPQVCLFNRS